MPQQDDWLDVGNEFHLKNYTLKYEYNLFCVKLIPPQSYISNNNFYYFHIVVAVLQEEEKGNFFYENHFKTAKHQLE